MRQMTETGENELASIAERHGVSKEAARHVLEAVAAGGGRQAQFSHPELGGMAQWSEGGMTMVGDIFDNGLKAKVQSLCADLSALAGRPDLFETAPQNSRTANAEGASGTVDNGRFWPEGLGHVGASGAQNGWRYAVFPETRRLAVEHDGRVKIYDTRDHRIAGVSQQQSASQSLTFTSQHGTVDLAALQEVSGEAEPEPEPEPTTEASRFEAVLADAFAPDQPAPGEPPEPAAPSSAGQGQSSDVLGTIERLAGLHSRGILTDQEFQAKKAELLARL